MTDDERADWLARAIDDIIRGDEPPHNPPTLAPEEAESLLQAARLRLESGRAAQQAAADHESATWERLVARLERHEPSSPAAAQPEPTAAHEDDLRQVIGLRMHLANEAIQIAEQHREEVWARVRKRLGGEGDAISHSEIAQQAAGPTQVKIQERRRRADVGTLPETADEQAEREDWVRRVVLISLVVAVLAITAAIAAVQLT